MKTKLIKLCLGLAVVLPIGTASADFWDYWEGRDRDRYERERDRDWYDRDHYRTDRFDSSYRGNAQARPCPFSCKSEGIAKSNCKDWREGNMCFVQIVPYNDHPSARSARRR